MGCLFYWGEMMKQAKDYKVLFYSEDGINFKLYIEGQELTSTRGVTIKAGNQEEIVVSPNIVIPPKGMQAFKEKKHWCSVHDNGANPEYTHCTCFMDIHKHTLEMLNREAGVK